MNPKKPNVPATHLVLTSTISCHVQKRKTYQGREKLLQRGVQVNIEAAYKLF